MKNEERINDKTDPTVTTVSEKPLSGILERVSSIADKTAAEPKPQSAVLPGDFPQSRPYKAMLNGMATNQLVNINSGSLKPAVDLITGSATIERGTLRVFIDSFSELSGGLRVSTSKLLDACTIVLTENNDYRGSDKDISPTVTIPLDTYMEMCGIPNTKPSKDKTRRKVKEDLETLFCTSIEWTEKSGGRQKDFAKMRICEKVGIINGNIVFTFSSEMAKYLTNAYIMQYPTEILSLDERNPNIYSLGRKLMLHNSIDNNRNKGTANIISVASLLETCPDIPTYEEVMSGGRQIEQRIIRPLENALNSLAFIRWEYSNSKGVPLTDEQLAATDYKTFSELYVRFEVIDAPDQSARLERKSKAENAQKKESGRRRRP